MKENLIPEDLIGIFPFISLEEMGKVKLMNRIDTKFITNRHQVINLLELASSGYLMQKIDERCNMPYFTRYFDTFDADMYYQHQRGKKNRRKVRIRKYEGSEVDPFLEIKIKNNRGRTKKERLNITEGEEIFDFSEFVEKYSLYPVETLTPVIDNHFYRITLVNQEMTERVTIDTGLEFKNIITGNYIDLSDLAIIEWKRDTMSVKSGISSLIRKLPIYESGFSKYCVGMAITNPDLKQNKLKPKIRLIERICRPKENS